jgi:hypothetical protein
METNFNENQCESIQLLNFVFFWFQMTGTVLKVMRRLQVNVQLEKLKPELKDHIKDYP